MAYLGHFTHATSGWARQANSTNEPTIVASPIEPDDVYSIDMDIAAGDKFGVSNRVGGCSNAAATTGAIVAYGSNTIYAKLAFELVALPDKYLSLFQANTGTGALNNTLTIAAIRIDTDGKLYFHDAATISNTTHAGATAASDVALATGKYILLWKLNVTTKAYEALVYNVSGVLVATIAAGTAADLGASTISVIYSTPNADPLHDTITDTTAHYRLGQGIAKSDAYPSLTERVGTLRPVAAGTYSNFTASAGTTYGACSDSDPATYIKSTAVNDVTTFAMQTCANAGILGTPKAFGVAHSPYAASGTTGSQLLFRENGTDTVLTSESIGTAYNRHIREKLYETMPSDGSALTLAKIEAVEVGSKHLTNTTELRVGEHWLFVIFVPAPTVTSIDPTTVQQGATNVDITISGTGFIDGAEAAPSGTGYSVNSTTFVSATELTMNVDIANDATANARDIVVTNPDGQSGTLAGALTVTAAGGGGNGIPGSFAMMGIGV